MVIPLVAVDGAKGAFSIWRSFKSVGQVVKDICNGLSLYAQFAGSPDAPLTGMEFVQEVELAVDQISERAEQKQAGRHMDEESKSEEDGSPFTDLMDGENVEFDSESIPDLIPVAAPVAPRGMQWKPEYAEIKIQCPICPPGAEGRLADHRHGCAWQAFIPNDRPANEFHRGMRKIWQEQVDQQHLQRLATEIRAKPWIMPVVIFLLLALAIAIHRIVNKKPTITKAEMVMLDRLKMLQEKYLRERGKSGKSKALGTRVSKRKKNWTPSSTDASVSEISEDEGVFYTDELGNQGRRAGKRAARTAKRAMEQRYGKYQKEKGTFPDDVESVFLYLIGSDGVIHYFTRLAHDDIERLNKRKNTENVLLESGDHFLTTDEVIKKRIQLSAKESEMVEKKNQPKESAVIAQTNSLNKHISCRNCLGVGHYASRCPAARCYRCKVRGHTKSACVEKCPVCGIVDFCTCDIPYKPIVARASVKKESVIADPSSTSAIVAQAIVKKESMLLKGSRLEPVNIAKKICIFVQRGVEESDFVNATFTCNGIVVSEHIFRLDADSDGPLDVMECDVYWFNNGTENHVVVKATDGVKIGNDLLFYKRPGAFQAAPMLTVAKKILTMGDEVYNVSYPTLSHARQGNFSVAKGRTLKIYAKSGSEMAEYDISTMGGMCSSPVLNSLGQLVGFHNAGGQGANRFIPITEGIAMMLTGNQVFQGALPQHS